jgi:L-alanine-DL-glutamate epimerase-like enolase superfamily enzyme
VAWGYRNTFTVISQTAAQSQREEMKITIAKSPLGIGAAACADRLDPDCGFWLAGGPEDRVAGIDMAAWGALARATGVPLCVLLGELAL